MEPQIITRWSQKIVASAAKTATGGQTFTLPHSALDACFVLDVTANAATTPTLTVDIATSPDQGTTWYACFRFAAITTTNLIQRMVCVFNASGQNTGTTSTSANSGNVIAITDNTSSRTLLTTAFSSGCPVIPDYMKVRWFIGGTSPSYTLACWAWGTTTGRGLVES